ncbi:DNA end protector during packaging [Agrobacterium phage OLIVR5]|uniref:DNA end protector during packaging n=1 Tax=Agrobacterium phage OLIVR5 TaxID=2723773 RepID=A0A858MV35_9CAUD|nr:DNA end protector [Agrobacterium phage OLIVR5]QIW87810.1 DNA end protector during packaging [Agrobacterium phage OLIVR5]QIW88075.1 DNA end protector protein [Agrobacterium phage OLIVR6]
MARKNEESEAQKRFSQMAKDLEKANQGNINKRIRESVKYFAEKNSAKFVDTGRANISLMTKGQRTASDYLPGQIFTFSYHPKHAETLPYYDRFPLILFLDVQKNGNLLALNLHYLNPVIRSRILGKIISTVGSNTMRHDTQMKITYGMVKEIAAYKPLGFAIKSYIPSHVAGKVVRIQPQDWDKAVVFPSQLFVGKSQESIWKEARKRFGD